MKFLYPLMLITVFTISSCASETELEQENNDTFLKSYTLSRDVEGNYTIDYDLKEDTSVDSQKNEETNTNEIYLFSGDVSVENKQSGTIALEEDELKFGFYEEDEFSGGITIYDEETNDYLQSYSITSLGDDTYQVDFTVAESVFVVYEFNEELDAYEIHLQVGVSKGNTYSKTYVKTADVLKINFVNYSNSGLKARGSSGPGDPRSILI